MTIDGEEVRDMNVQWLRNMIGVVSQEPILFHASVADNVRMGRANITREEMEQVCRMANAHEFIEELPKVQ